PTDDRKLYRKALWITMDCQFESKAVSPIMANPKYAVSDKPVPVSELVATLSDGTKVKRRIPRMRACNEKDEKGKMCAGHLKRWFFFGDEVKQKFGANAEVYRCEHCKTLYLPNP